MPIYEYQCQNCRHEFEALQKISDAPLEECPDCDQPSLKKKVSAAAFRLKGGGWYETDFKSGNKKNLVGDSSSSSESTSDQGAEKPKASEVKNESKSKSESASSKPAANGTK